MAPLSVDNTARYKVFYTVSGVQHVQQIRTGAVSPSALGTYVDSYYTAIAPNIYEVTIDQIQFAGSGSSVFNAVTTGIESSTYGSGSAAVAGENAYFYDFVGRSSGGRRVRFTQYGAKTLGGDYRFVSGEDTDLDGALDVIEAASSTWLAIDAIKPSWKSYINAGVNAYWQRQLRP